MTRLLRGVLFRPVFELGYRAGLRYSITKSSGRAGVRPGGCADLHAINYEAPKTLKDAVALLAQHGEKARALCGGTDLIIQLRAGVRRPDHVVDVKKISELM